MIKKYKKNNFYENYTLHEEIDTEYKTQLQTINYMFKKYQKFTKNYKHGFTFLETNQRQTKNQWKNTTKKFKQLRTKYPFKKMYFPKYLLQVLSRQKKCIIQQEQKQKKVTYRKKAKYNRNATPIFNNFQ